MGWAEKGCLVGGGGVPGVSTETPRAEERKGKEKWEVGKGESGHRFPDSHYFSDARSSLCQKDLGL